ncbi:unnamed protein product [Amoebophrya sp. A120]|nr:unnamed protein product [Amoebophrya sp. A120]|eukprot:GSA120T00017481001.1
MSVPDHGTRGDPLVSYSLKRVTGTTMSLPLFRFACFFLLALVFAANAGTTSGSKVGMNENNSDHAYNTPHTDEAVPEDHEELYEWVWVEGVLRRLPGTKGSPAAYSPIPMPVPVPAPVSVRQQPSAGQGTMGGTSTTSSTGSGMQMMDQATMNALAPQMTQPPMVYRTTTTTAPPQTDAPPNFAFQATEKVVAVPAVLDMTIPAGKEISSLKNDADFTTALCKGVKSAMNAADATECRVIDVRQAEPASSSATASAGSTSASSATSTRRQLQLSAPPTEHDTENKFLRGGVMAPRPQEIMTNMNRQESNHGSINANYYSYSSRLLTTSSSSLSVDFELKVADDSEVSAMTSKLQESDMASKIKQKTNIELSSGGSTTSGFQVQSVSNTETAGVSEIHELDWSLMTGQEYKMLVCDKGNKIRFKWTNANMQHDVQRINLESEYVGCDFTHATKMTEIGSSGSYTMNCDKQGMHFFSCSVPGHCTDAKQKIRVQVTDLSKTATLRNMVNTDPKYNGAKHWTYAMAMSGYFVDADFANGFATNAAADTAQFRLWCVLPHAREENGLGCSDWLPADYNNAEVCEAWIESDIGYAWRKRPTPNYAEAEKYYDKALTILPKFCPALSYKTGLYVQKGDASRAHGVFPEACAECGNLSLDMELVKKGYAEKGWKLPCGTACSGSDCVTYNNVIAHTIGSTSTSMGMAGGMGGGNAAMDEEDMGMSSVALIGIIGGGILGVLGLVAVYYFFIHDPSKKTVPEQAAAVEKPKKGGKGGAGVGGDLDTNSYAVEMKMKNMPVSQKPGAAGADASGRCAIPEDVAITCPADGAAPMDDGTGKKKKRRDDGAPTSSSSRGGQADPARSGKSSRNKPTDIESVTTASSKKSRRSQDSQESGATRKSRDSSGSGKNRSSEGRRK